MSRRVGLALLLVLPGLAAPLAAQAPPPKARLPVTAGDDATGRPEDRYGVLSGVTISPKEIVQDALCLFCGIVGFARRWEDPKSRERILDLLRPIEREPALLGMSPHLLAVGQRPESETGGHAGKETG